MTTLQRTAIVVGVGSAQGLGAALARRFAIGGHRVIVSGRTEAKIAEGYSNVTVNRMLALLRAILRKCVNDWEWIDRIPKARMLQEPRRRIRFVTYDVVEGMVGRE